LPPWSSIRNRIFPHHNRGRKARCRSAGCDGTARTPSPTGTDEPWNLPAHMNIIIDRDFKSLIPPLTESELTELHNSLITHGCRDRLIVWKGKGILLDGHNRHAFCTERKIPFEVFEVTCSDREQAANFIRKNQLARRNLTPDQLSFIRGALLNSIKGKQGGDHKSKCQSDTLIDAAEVVAKQTGVSPATAKRDGKFAEAVEEQGLTAEVMAGKNKVPRREIVKRAAKSKEPTAYQERKARERIKDRERVAEQDRIRKSAPYLSDNAIATLGRIDPGDPGLTDALGKVLAHIESRTGSKPATSPETLSEPDLLAAVVESLPNWKHESRDALARALKRWEAKPGPVGGAA